MCHELVVALILAPRLFRSPKYYINWYVRAGAAAAPTFCYAVDVVVVVAVVVIVVVAVIVASSIPAVNVVTYVAHFLLYLAAILGFVASPSLSSLHDLTFAVLNHFGVHLDP